MDKLITSLDTNLGSVLREQLDTNFQKIQNGVDGQADSLNKQIKTMLGDVPLQDKNEVTQARIDSNGVPYQTLKGRLDVNQSTAETALKEERLTGAEVQSARSNTSGKNYDNLKARLDDTEANLTNNMNAKISQISSVPETFASLSALQSTYPNGKTGLFVAADNGHKYIWANNVWTDAGVYQAVGIAEKSITAPMTNFLIKASILTDDITVKIDESLKSNIGLDFSSSTLDNPNNIVWYKVPVTGGRSYSAYYHNMPKLPTQLVIMEFKNGISTKRYSVPGDNPTFIVDPATDYVHISLASSKADYTSVKIILSEASSYIGKNAVETDNSWEARLTLDYS